LGKVLEVSGGGAEKEVRAGAQKKMEGLYVICWTGKP
jgi:hypothetical protein